MLLSHSSSRALTNVPRNVTDAMLRAVAQNGGAVCVNFNPGFLDIDYNRAQAPLWAALQGPAVRSRDGGGCGKSRHACRPSRLSRLVDHVMHMVQVAGVDHVCLGSDFDGIPATPRGWKTPATCPR